MADYKKWLNQFSSWLKDVKEHELDDLSKRFWETQKEFKEYTKHTFDDYYYYLKRDVEHFLENKAHYDDVAWQETKANILFEISQMEDRTQLEWTAMLRDFEHQGVYKQGEWIALGQLVCKNCGHKFDVYYATEIPECSECGHGEYIRRALAP
ncbi:zinc ribbon-containing protein [Pseudoalteromonas sp. T1lg65]|uniref:zinc ribbon-containing protein n=1 Tax=Pseudoalteromonas sp. T1lg65 TaxID=2077101 RepID=UPI003F79B462